MYREPTVKGRKPGLKSMIWSRRRKETFNRNIMKKQEFKKMGRDRFSAFWLKSSVVSVLISLKNGGRLRNLLDNLKHSNILIIGVPEGEEEEKEMENLFNRIVKENFPKMAKEIDFQEDQRVPKKLDPRK